MSRNPFMIATPPTALKEKSKNIGKSDSSAAGDGASLFRPSALSSVADTMWKSTTTSTNDGEKKLIPSIFEKSTADANNKKSSQETNVKPQASTFVFGCKIKDRVESSAAVPDKPSEGFSALAKQKTTDETPSATNKEETNDASTSKERMMASAAQLEQSRTRTTTSTAVDQTTGEENDNQLCRTSCKLHQFENGEWVERGTGVIVINQMEGSDEIRLVMRRAATHQLMLNSKLYSGMTLERLSPKRIKFSAVDAGTKAVALYLMTAPDSSTDEFWRLMESRLKRLPAAPAKPDRKRAADDNGEEATKKTKDDEKTDNGAAEGIKTKEDSADAKKEEV